MTILDAEYHLLSNFSPFYINTQLFYNLSSKWPRPAATAMARLSSKLIGNFLPGRSMATSHMKSMDAFRVKFRETRCKRSVYNYISNNAYHMYLYPCVIFSMSIIISTYISQVVISIEVEYKHYQHFSSEMNSLLMCHTINKSSRILTQQNHLFQLKQATIIHGIILKQT